MQVLGLEPAPAGGVGADMFGLPDGSIYDRHRYVHFRAPDGKLYELVQER